MAGREVQRVAVHVAAVRQIASVLLVSACFLGSGRPAAEGQGKREHFVGGFGDCVGTSLKEAAARFETILLGQITGSHRDPTNTRSSIYTLHDVLVLRVIKGASNVVAEGRRIVVRQYGGEFETQTDVYRSYTRPLSLGTHVLFLRANSGGTFSPHCGSMPVREGRVVGGYIAEARGWTIQELVDHFKGGR